MDILQIFRSGLSSNSFTVGTAAVQISGGPPSAWPLTAVTATYYPNYHRAVIRIINNNGSTAIIYVGSTSAVTSTSGYFKELLASQLVEVNVSGSVPIWLISNQAGTVVTVEEFA